MDKFRYLKRSEVKFFLNKKSLTILMIINSYPNIFSKNLLESLEENGLNIKKSQFYRYIYTLGEHDLIKISPWIKSAKGNGYSFRISESGRELLYFFSI